MGLPRGRITFAWRPSTDSNGKRPPEAELPVAERPSVEADIAPRANGFFDASFELPPWRLGALYQCIVRNDLDEIVFNGPVALADGMELVANRRVTLSGRLSNLRGEAIADAHVEIRGRHEASVGPWLHVAATTTDAEGRFFATARPHRPLTEYVLDIRYGEGIHLMRSLSAETLEGSGATVVLHPVAVEVWAHDEHGRPLNGAEVRWRRADQDERFARDAVTDDQGRARIWTEPGPLIAVVTCAGRGWKRIEREVGVHAADVAEVVLEERVDRVLHGRVVDGLGNAIGAYVTARPAVEDWPVMGEITSSADSDPATGAFELPLSCGVDSLLIASDPVAGFSKTMVVHPWDEGVTLSFEAHGSLRVFLTGAIAGLPALSGPFSIYYAHRERHRIGHAESFHTPAYVESLLPGDYNVFVRMPGDSGLFGQASVTVRNGERADVVVELGVETTFGGCVVDEDGDPVAGAEVALLSPLWWFDPNQSWGFARTDGRGVFSVPGGFSTAAQLAVRVGQAPWRESAAQAGSHNVLVVPTSQ